jgi:hypothetical protein
MNSQQVSLQLDESCEPPKIITNQNITSLLPRTDAEGAGSLGNGEMVLIK